MDMELIDKTGVLIVNKLQWHGCQVSGLLHEVLSRGKNSLATCGNDDQVESHGWQHADP